MEVQEFAEKVVTILEGIVAKLNAKENVNIQNLEARIQSLEQTVTSYAS